jgi:hypothetical protein
MRAPAEAVSAGSARGRARRRGKEMGEHSPADHGGAAGPQGNAAPPAREAVPRSSRDVEAEAARLAELAARELGADCAYVALSRRGGTELEFVIMVIAVSCVKLLSAHNSTQHTSRKHKV